MAKQESNYPAKELLEELRAGVEIGKWKDRKQFVRELVRRNPDWNPRRLNKIAVRDGWDAVVLSVTKQKKVEEKTQAYLDVKAALLEDLKIAGATRKKVLMLMAEAAQSLESAKANATALTSLTNGLHQMELDIAESARSAGGANSDGNVYLGFPAREAPYIREYSAGANGQRVAADTVAAKGNVPSGASQESGGSAGNLENPVRNPVADSGNAR